VSTPAGTSAYLGQILQKPLAVAIVAEDQFAPISPIEHMINRPGKFNTRFASNAYPSYQLSPSSPRANF